MKSNAIIAIIVSLVVLCAAFVVLTSDLLIDSNTIDNKESEDETPEALGNKTSFNDAVNAFAFDLFRKISNDPVNEGNIFYSPYSVFTLRNRRPDQRLGKEKSPKGEKMRRGVHWPGGRESSQFRGDRERLLAKCRSNRSRRRDRLKKNQGHCQRYCSSYINCL